MPGFLKRFFKKKSALPLNRKNLGVLGEESACQYLVKNNYAIIEQNFRCPSGEIDIIAREKDTVIFVEVKSQYEYTPIRPERKVDARKQKKLLHLARYYRRLHLTPETPCRIDVITVILTHDNKPSRIIHYKRAI